MRLRIVEGDDGDERRHREDVTCGWNGVCRERGVHALWRQPRLGLIVHLDVCERHLEPARASGYRQDPPPIPPPEPIDDDFCAGDKGGSW